MTWSMASWKVESKDRVDEKVGVERERGVVRRRK